MLRPVFGDIYASAWQGSRAITTQINIQLAFSETTLKMGAKEWHFVSASKECIQI